MYAASSSRMAATLFSASWLTEVHYDTLGPAAFGHRIHS
jgi:hypothetical protein